MAVAQDEPDVQQPYEHVIRVAWGDCDPANIVYTGRIPWFALDAINAWWEHHTGSGWYQFELDRDMGTPFVSMKLDFRSPITPRHRLICKVWPNRLGTTSVGFRVLGFQDDTLCFEGEFVSVFTQASAFTKAPPPDDIRQIVERYLKSDP